MTTPPLAISVAVGVMLTLTAMARAQTLFLRYLHPDGKLLKVLAGGVTAVQLQATIKLFDQLTVTPSVRPNRNVC